MGGGGVISIILFITEFIRIYTILASFLMVKGKGTTIRLESPEGEEV
jgi:hypothetical protein